jgi:predicted acylesterase/phospholipase RssA
MQYDLVFEGGGAKGMAFVGALQELQAQGCSAGRLLGTSAGAITAALLAAGYTIDEMEAALNEKANGRPVFEQFMGAPLPFSDAEVQAGAFRTFLGEINLPLVGGGWEESIKDKLARALADHPRFRHLLALVERGGWFSADKFVAWLQRKLDEGTHRGKRRAYSNMTLAQFFAATQTELSLVASDTTAAHMLVLNHRTAPNCSLVWAVRMSMSIPLVWDEVEWQASWNPYCTIQGQTQRDHDLSGHTIVDGGVLSNFPIDLFLSDDNRVVSLMGPFDPQSRLIGLLIDEALPLSNALNRPQSTGVNSGLSWGKLATIQRLARLIDTATTAHDKAAIEEYARFVVRLPALGYGTTEFDMSDARRNALVAAGRAAMAAYLPGRLQADSTPADVSFTPGEDRDAPARAVANRRALQILSP